MKHQSIHCHIRNAEYVYVMSSVFESTSDRWSSSEWTSTCDCTSSWCYWACSVSRWCHWESCHRHWSWSLNVGGCGCGNCCWLHCRRHSSPWSVAVRCLEAPCHWRCDVGASLTWPFCRWTGWEMFRWALEWWVCSRCSAWMWAERSWWLLGLLFFVCGERGCSEKKGELDDIAHANSLWWRNKSFWNEII